MCHCNMYSYGYNEFCFMRVKCIVSYDGTRFHGFQVQNNERTIQGEIQKAIKIHDIVQLRKSIVIY